MNLKIHGDDMKFACFKTINLKIMMLLTIILCMPHYDIEKYITINNIDIIPNPNGTVFYEELYLKFWDAESGSKTT